MKQLTDEVFAQALEATNSANMATCKGIIQGLEAEVERLTRACQAMQLAKRKAEASEKDVWNERETLRAQLAAAQGQEPTGYLLPTTGKFVHAGTVMTGHAGTNWIKLYADPIPQQVAPSVPEGWKLVPIEPTEAMLEVGFFAENDVFDSAKTKRIHVWKDMLAAAPQPKEK